MKEIISKTSVIGDCFLAQPFVLYSASLCYSLVFLQLYSTFILAKVVGQATNNGRGQAPTLVDIFLTYCP